MSTATHGNVPELTLGWRLKMALGETKVEQMAETLGVHRGTIGRWMRDDGAPPRRAYLLQWAILTGTDPQWLETGRASSPSDPDGGGRGSPTIRYVRPRSGTLSYLVAA